MNCNTRPQNTKKPKKTMKVKQTGKFQVIESLQKLQTSIVESQDDDFFTCANDAASKFDTALDFEPIQERPFFKLQQPLGASYSLTMGRKASGKRFVKDPIDELLQKHTSAHKVLELGDKRFDAYTMQVSRSQPMNGKVSKKTLKKPKILKSDGKTVTAESVMRMVDPSFLVYSDADDSSMISTSAMFGNKGKTVVNNDNFLAALKNFDQIDETLSKSRSGLRQIVSM